MPNTCRSDSFYDEKRGRCVRVEYAIVKKGVPVRMGFKTMEEAEKMMDRMGETLPQEEYFALDVKRLCDGTPCPIRVKSHYEIVTEESAKEGDIAESGWLEEQGIKYDDVEEVASYLESEGVLEREMTGTRPGWYMTGEEIDIYTGDSETRSYFIEDASEDEMEEIDERIARRR